MGSQNRTLRTSRFGGTLASMSNEDDELYGYEMSEAMQEKLRLAAEANAGMEQKLSVMGEEDLRSLASDIENLLAERFQTTEDVTVSDVGIEVMSMFLPQSMMNAVLPYISGILLTEDDVVVLPDSDLPVMCRIDGYIPV